jgi:hypothetical protein
MLLSEAHKGSLRCEAVLLMEPPVVAPRACWWLLQGRGPGCFQLSTLHLACRVCHHACVALALFGVACTPLCPRSPFVFACGRYFDSCPVMEIPGRAFPVKTLFLEHAIEHRCGGAFPCFFLVLCRAGG